MDEPRRAPLSLGEFIRRQRELAELPLRQLAAMTGISNPYLSQIEHGLRMPSDQVLRGIADSLKVSVDEMLAAMAPPPSSGEPGDSAVLDAIRSDPDLTAAQRRSLIETYSAMAEVTRGRKGRRRGKGADS